MIFDKILKRKIKVLEGKNIELEDENKKLRAQVRGFKAGIARKKNKVAKDSIRE